MHPSNTAERKLHRPPSHVKSAARVEALEARQLLAANLVADYGGFFPTDTVTVGGTSYFAADDGVHGKELWRSDGTPRGTRLVIDATPGSSSSLVRGMHELDGRLLFFAFDTEASAISLWSTDGTPGAARLLKTFRFEANVSIG